MTAHEAVPSSKHAQESVRLDVERLSAVATVAGGIKREFSYSSSCKPTRWGGGAIGGGRHIRYKNLSTRFSCPKRNGATNR